MTRIQNQFSIVVSPLSYPVNCCAIMMEQTGVKRSEKAIHPNAKTLQDRIHFIGVCPRKPGAEEEDL